MYTNLFPYKLPPHPPQPPNPLPNIRMSTIKPIQPLHPFFITQRVFNIQMRHPLIRCHTPSIIE